MAAHVAGDRGLKIHVHKEQQGYFCCSAIFEKFPTAVLQLITTVCVKQLHKHRIVIDDIWQLIDLAKKSTSGIFLSFPVPK